MNRIIAIVLLFCSVALSQTSTSKAAINPKPTAADAEKFVADAEKQLFDLSIKAQRSGWVQENFITDDTEQMAADINDQLTELATRLAKEAVRFDGLTLPYDTARKLQLIKLALTLPAPSNDAERQEVTRLEVKLDGEYGRGKYCPAGERTLTVSRSATR